MFVRPSAHLSILFAESLRDGSENRNITTIITPFNVTQMPHTSHSGCAHPLTYGFFSPKVCTKDRIIAE